MNVVAGEINLRAESSTILEVFTLIKEICPLLWYASYFESALKSGLFGNSVVALIPDNPFLDLKSTTDDSASYVNLECADLTRSVLILESAREVLIGDSL